MTTVNNIFTPSHFISPFTVPAQERGKPDQLTTMEKTAAVALSILVGAFTGVTGGVITFYLVTATMKAMMLRDTAPSKILIQEPAKSPSITRIPLARLLQDFYNKPVTPYPVSVQNRRFPPFSTCDTVCFENGQIRGTRPATVPFYRDDEIIELHPSTQEVNIGKDIMADMIDNTKVVILQQAKRGCTAAVAAMLIYDAGKPINPESLKETNLGNTQDMERWITLAGLTAKTTNFHSSTHTGESIDFLQQAILENGPAIV